MRDGADLLRSANSFHQDAVRTILARRVLLDNTEIKLPLHIRLPCR